MGLWLYVNVSIQLFFQMPKSILFPTWKKAKEKKKNKPYIFFEKCENCKIVCHQK